MAELKSVNINHYEHPKLFSFRIGTNSIEQTVYSNIAGEEGSFNEIKFYQKISQIENLSENDVLYLCLNHTDIEKAEYVIPPRTLVPCHNFMTFTTMYTKYYLVGKKGIEYRIGLVPSNEFDSKRSSMAYDFFIGTKLFRVQCGVCGLHAETPDPRYFQVSNKADPEFVGAAVKLWLSNRPIPNE